MSLHTLGLNHATAPLEVREKVAFAPDVLTDALRDLTGARKVREAAILSTCNRTEVYFHGDDPQWVARWLERVQNLSRDALEPYVYTLPRAQTVAHAFRVASGLDSAVLGEPQILGQMKQAVRSAEAAGSLGVVLNAPSRSRRMSARRPISAALRFRWPPRQSSLPNGFFLRSRISDCC